MSYMPTAFPSSIAPTPTGGPSFSTTITSVLSGDEQANQNWLRSRHTYEMSQGIKTAADFKAIGAHFRMARGKLHHFRVRDWGDYTCTRDEGALIQLTSTTFQLTKVYGDDPAFREERRITRPVAGTIQVWKNAALLALGSDYNIDADDDLGVVTFAVAPGAATLECAFSFDVPCRYDTDELRATLIHLKVKEGSDNPASLISWDQVPLVERRE